MNTCVVDASIAVKWFVPEVAGLNCGSFHNLNCRGRVTCPRILNLLSDTLQDAPDQFLVIPIASPIQSVH